jgi:hypothetical protein
MRPLRTIAIAMADEYVIESPIFKKWTRKIILILFFFIFIIKDKNIGGLYKIFIQNQRIKQPYPKPTQVRR